MSVTETSAELIMGWNGPIAVLDVWCGELDRRMFHEVEWPDLPRSMGSSHWSDTSVGTVDEIQVLTAPDGTRYVWGRGRFTDTDEGRQAAQQVADGSLRTVSIEVRDGEFVEWPILDEDTGDEIGWAMEWNRAVIGAFALERNPAFAGAVIVPDAEAAAFVYEPPTEPNPADGTAPDDGARPDTDPVEVDGELAATVATLRTVADPAVVRAAGAGPATFPAAHFARPEDGFTYAEQTRLTIGSDGEVTGHVLPQGARSRTTRDDPWVAARNPNDDLSEWLVGATPLDDGRLVMTGVIVSDGLHGPAHQAGSSGDDMRRLIESTATQVAQVTAWWDEFGLAVHGSTSPGVTPEQATRAMAGCPSVDERFFDERGWMTTGVLCVNTCRFSPGQAMVRVASGQPVQRLRGASTGCGCGGGAPGPGGCTCGTAARSASGEDEAKSGESAGRQAGRLARLDREFERERLRNAAQAVKPKG